MGVSESESESVSESESESNSESESESERECASESESASECECETQQLCPPEHTAVDRISFHIDNFGKGYLTHKKPPPRRTLPQAWS